MQFRAHAFLHKLPPGPSKFPYIGIRETVRAYANPLGTFMGYTRDYGPVWTTRFLGGIEMVFLIGPEANQHVLVDNHDNFSWREGFLGDLVPFIGEGMLTTDGHVHDKARKLMLPVFRPDRIRAYAEQMVARSGQLADTLVEGEHVEMYNWTRELALQIAGDVLFGMETDQSLAHRFARYFETGLNFYGLPIHFQVLRGPGSPWSIQQKARKKMDRILYREIRQRRRRGANGENIIDLLINAREEGERFTDKEIRDQVMTLLFAGHDTTTATVSWMLTLLGTHPEVYRRLVEEIDTVLGGRTPSADDLNDRLPYLDQVLAETLRLYPPAWIGPRRAIDDFEIYGHKIPGGTNVAYSSWISHRLPHVFPDPDAFDPERMTKDKIKALQPGAYVPFGRGRRLCIGMRFGEMEAKAIMTSLLQRVHLELSPGQDFRPRTVPTISPRFGVHMYVRPKGALVTGVEPPPAPRPKVAAIGGGASGPGDGNGGCPIAH